MAAGPGSTPRSKREKTGCKLMTMMGRGRAMIFKLPAY
ncbi:hypothetical protein AG1IA_03831 [Rhizoctonia solani AG-1 IA]|uniref:Uncharacterized protein n=1 Tax=Thanatephorus cucumeris (strain AG1-IA) TaxID=983506 RepID=L8X0I9_THACA|nr:hypothetical protein AG1IA_03831 [Rhizoctonia solani AG-1 IA]